MAPSLFVNVAIFVILNFVYFLIQRNFVFKVRILTLNLTKLAQKSDFLAYPQEQRYYSGRSDLTFGSQTLLISIV